MSQASPTSAPPSTGPSPIGPLRACHCCGLVQQLPPLQPKERAVCVRCGTHLRHGDARRNRWTAVLAASALAFYPPAMTLPLLRMEQLGYAHEDSLLSGVVALWSQGYWFLGGIIFLLSVLLPPLKLMALWLLSTPRLVAGHSHRALTYHAVELLGRWGMLDVMLVAVLVAMVKLGDLVHIQPGPGLLAFTILVLLSLLAGVVFDPQLMWRESEQET